MQAMKGAYQRPENWIVQGDFGPESGYRAMQQILNQHLPTAVFCGGDIMAMGAIARRMKWDCGVPPDISLIGYDNAQRPYFSRR